MKEMKQVIESKKGERKEKKKERWIKGFIAIIE
jgi:hypothetical protein